MASTNDRNVFFNGNGGNDEWKINVDYNGTTYYVAGGRGVVGVYNDTSGLSRYKHPTTVTPNQVGLESVVRSALNIFFNKD